MLRQKVSMPLDRLVQPVTLAEWRNAATIEPLASTSATRQSPNVLPLPAKSAPASEITEQASTTTPAEEAYNNPFADDPAPPAEGKIPSGKLLGIVGRALFESAPVPSLEGLREKLPNVPIPAGDGTPTTAEDDFGAAPGFAPLDASDPFSEPAASPAEDGGSNDSTQPDEDPFG